MISTTAGISYVFNDIQSESKCDLVTASSTIIDPQGILKYVIYPPMRFSHLHPPPSMISMRRRCQSNLFRMPFNHREQINVVKKDFSMVFFWSIPLKARLVQTPTKSAVIVENSNHFQYYSMKISIGTQSGIDDNLPSEIALSNSNETLDSLSSNPLINDSLMSNRLLKKNKFEMDRREINEKRFRLDREGNKEEMMRNVMTKNIKLCMENLTKILVESSSNTLQNPQEKNVDHTGQSSKLSIKHQFKTEDHRDSNEDASLNRFYLHHENPPSDGIIIHRGEQFGLALGEPMIRKLHIDEYHSIDQFNRLFSQSTCFLMQQNHIQSIEDLIRLYIHHGEDNFTKLMIEIFKIDTTIVRQLNSILCNWTKQLI